MTVLLESIDLFIQIVKNWSGHGLTGLTSSYGPAIKEACLCSEELELIDCTLNMYFGSAYIRTLIQHKVSRGIKLCGTLYGSVNSIHRKSSLVYVKSHSSIHTCAPAFVQKYITVNTLLSTDNDSSSKSVAVTLAGINWMLPHENKNWYGAPVEVWRVYQPSIFPDAYIPISNMLCRCAYVTETVMINEVLDTVTIVVPINNFAGL